MSFRKFTPPMEAVMEGPRLSHQKSRSFNSMPLKSCMGSDETSDFNAPGLSKPFSPESEPCSPDIMGLPAFDSIMSDSRNTFPALANGIGILHSCVSPSAETVAMLGSSASLNPQCGMASSDFGLPGRSSFGSHSFSRLGHVAWVDPNELYLDLNNSRRRQERRTRFTPSPSQESDEGPGQPMDEAELRRALRAQRSSRLKGLLKDRTAQKKAESLDTASPHNIKRHSAMGQHA